MMTGTADISAEIKSRLNLQEEFSADYGSSRTFKREGNDCFAWECPFHDEKTGSCKVHPNEGYFNCFGCGKKGDIFNYIGFVIQKDPKHPKDFVEILREGCQRAGIEFPESEKSSAPEKPVEPKKIYTLEKLKQCCEWQASENQERCTFNESTNPDTGVVEFVEVRFDHKTRGRTNGKPSKRFLQCQSVEGGFIFGLSGEKVPLFNRKRVKETQFVALVEGAKCAKFLQSIGIVATAAAGGSKNPVANVDWTPLTGKTVVIWPDNDNGGIEWANAVCKALESICFVHIADISELGLQKSDDVVDFCERLKATPEQQRDAVELILDAAKPETLESQIAADINGTRFALRHDAFYALSSTLCFLPGSITMICANPGVSKSLLVLQWIWQLYFDGVDCSLLALESGSVFHERRCLAQMCGNSQILNPEWCTQNVDHVARVLDTFKPNLDEMRKNKIIQSPSDSAAIDCGYLLAWIQSEAKRGRKIVAIDPITMMETGPDFWEEQKQFVRDVKKIVRKTQIRLILVTHPKKGSQGPMLDNAAGAVAFSQNTDTFIWLEAHDPIYAQVPVAKDSMEMRQVKYNRTARLLKHRLGPAPKAQIGYYMNGETLKHDEIGFIDAV